MTPELTGRTAECWALREKGATYGEIGRALKLTRGSVRDYLRRAEIASVAQAAQGEAETLRAQVAALTAQLDARTAPEPTQSAVRALRAQLQAALAENSALRERVAAQDHTWVRGVTGPAYTCSRCGCRAYEPHEITVPCGRYRVERRGRKVATDVAS